MFDLLTQPATYLLNLLATGELSAEALATAYLDRIGALNPGLHALIDYDPERVLAAARALDRSSEPRGRLHGLPMTIKSSIAVAGHRCETGSLLNRGYVPTEDAETVKRLRRAGAVILGTTNCPEFLMAYETGNRLYGTTANPWDVTRTAGGSSGGESSAIAAGLSAAGLGSDGGGSVRVPAHFTGICALKPTPGRIPTDGHLAGNTGPFALLGTIGPMARTIADVDLLFRVVSGPLEADPNAVPVSYRPVCLEHLRQTPVAFFEDDGLIPVTAETRQAVRDAAHALRQQGFRVEPFRPPSLEAARRLWYKLFVGCGSMLLEPLTGGRESELSPIFLDFLDIARRTPPPTAAELLATWCEIDLVRAAFLAETRQHPILLSPVCAIPAFRHGERSWTVEDQAVDYLDAMRFTQWFNLLGCPAAVVPIARSAEGLPIGVQVAGRPYADEHVLGVAAILDQVFGYQAPPLFHRVVATTTHESARHSTSTKQ